jgi:hypothetical protein
MPVVAPMVDRNHPGKTPDCAHDNPPRWACMLAAYLDESIESLDGHAVVAGFLGNKESWAQSSEQWGKVLASFGRKSLHMRSLRWKRNRHKEMLSALAEVPHDCGLQPVFASVCFSDYKDEIEDYAIPGLTSGYLVAMYGCVWSLVEHLPITQDRPFGSHPSSRRRPDHC